MRDDWWPWLLRLLWLSLPFAAGPVLGDALTDVSRPVELTAAIALWALWAIPGILDHLWPLRDRRNQTFHDKFARSVVVRTLPSAPLQWSSKRRPDRVN